MGYGSASLLIDYHATIGSYFSDKMPKVLKLERKKKKVKGRLPAVYFYSRSLIKEYKAKGTKVGHTVLYAVLWIRNFFPSFPTGMYEQIN